MLKNRIAVGVLSLFMWMGFTTSAYAVNSPKTVVAQIKDSKAAFPVANNVTIKVTDGFSQTANFTGGVDASGIIAYTASNGGVTINMGNFTAQWVSGNALNISVTIGTAGQVGFEAGSSVTTLDATTLQSFNTDAKLAIVTAPRKNIASAGNSQSVTVQSVFSTPLKVFVGTGSTAAAGIAVTFKAPKGFVFATPTIDPYIQTVTTATDGYATASAVTAGTTAGVFNVYASATGYPTATFTETVTAGAAAKLTIDPISLNQTGTVGTQVATALGVQVNDQFNNPVSGATVVFAASSNGTKVAAINAAAATSATVTTATNGQAGVALFLSTTAGANTVTATVTGINPYTFTATGTAATAVGFTLNPYTTVVPSSVATVVKFSATTIDKYGNAVASNAPLWLTSKDTYSTVTTQGASVTSVKQNVLGATATATVDVYATAVGQGVTQTATIRLLPFGLKNLPLGRDINLITGQKFIFKIASIPGNNVTWALGMGAKGSLGATTGAGPVTYTASTTAGTDTLVVTDTTLNVTSQAVIRVYSPLTFVQGAKVGIQLGKQSGALSAQGGALPLTYTTVDTYVTLNAVTGDAYGASLGLATVSVTDGYTYDGTTQSNVTSIKIDVVNPITIAQTGTIFLDTVTNRSRNITVAGGSGAYIYTSSKPAAVTVLNGKLTAKAAGSATITVSEKNVAYSNITVGTVAVNVTAGLALVDPYGRALPNVLPGKVGSGQSLTMKLTGGSGSYRVSISGPVTASISSVGDLYTFSAPTTGAFAGAYTITFTDTVTNLTRVYTVVVPYRVEVSKRTVLTTDASQLVNVYGAAKGDTFTVAVLDPATKPLAVFAGNTTPPATATVATAAALGDSYAATVTVVPSKTTVTAATSILVRVTKSSGAANPQPTGEAPMVVAPSKTYTIAVTDAVTGKALPGATVVLNRPADFAGTMTTDSYGKTTFNLPDAGYRFEVSNGKTYLPGTVKVGFGSSNGATALTPLTNGVTYTVTVTSPYSGVRIAAFDANNKVIQGVVNGSTATVSFDPANFTLDRVMIAAKGAKPFVIKAAGFTANVATASLTGLPQITAADLGKVVQKARTLLSAGSVNPARLTKPAGVALIRALLKPQVGDTYTAPGTTAVALSGNRPVLQVMLDAAGAIVSAPVVHPPLSAPADGSTRIEDTGSTKPLTLGGTTAKAVSMPTMAVLKTVSIRLPATAFKQSVGQVFTSISAASIDSYSAQKAKADFTGGELVEIDLTVFNSAGTDVYTTDSGNSLIAGVPVTLPLDQYALIAKYNVTDAYGVKSVDSAAVIAAFANGTLAIWTARSIADFEAGIGLSQVAAADVTYNPATGEAEFTLTHFSAIGAGAGAGSTAAAAAGGSSSCVAPASSLNQLLVFGAILLMLGLMMRRRRS